MIYDELSLDGAWEICKNWSDIEREKLFYEVPKLGFKAKIRGKEIQEVAKEVLDLSKGGLQRRARANTHGTVIDEVGFLEPLINSVESGNCLADEILTKYESTWAQDLSRIYGDYSY